MIPHSNVNPIDLLEVLALADRINSDLRTMQAGLKSLRKNWQTSRAGLLPAARACSSLKVLTVECSALLSFMAENGGGLFQEAEPRPSWRSETSSMTLTPEVDQLESADIKVG